MVLAVACAATIVGGCSGRADATVSAVNDLDVTVVVRVDDAAGRSRQILLDSYKDGNVISVRGLTWPATVTFLDASTCAPIGSADLPHEASTVGALQDAGQTTVFANAKDSFGRLDPPTDKCT